jgi:hypothetical protein
MPEFSDDMLVEFALGLRGDREIKEAVEGSPELRTRLRTLESELRCLEDGLDGILAEAALGSALPCGGWRILLAIDDSQGAKRAAATADVLVRMAGGEVEVLHVRETAQGKAGPLSPETRAEAVALVTDTSGNSRSTSPARVSAAAPNPRAQEPSLVDPASATEPCAARRRAGPVRVTCAPGLPVCRLSSKASPTGPRGLNPGPAAVALRGSTSCARRRWP